MDEAALGKLSVIVEQLKLEMRNEGKNRWAPDCWEKNTI